MVQYQNILFLHLLWLYNRQAYQLLLIAFAIPPRACNKPGPETTKQTPGLQEIHIYNK